MIVEKKWNYYLTVVPIGAFFLVFLIWAALSNIDEVVRGEGRVVPSGQTKILSHAEGGIVQEILVSEGDKVKQSQPIYKLDQAFFSADAKEKDLDKISLLAKESRMVALINGASQPSFDQTVQNAPEIVRNEMMIFYSERQNSSERISVVRQKIEQRELEIRESESKLKNISLELDMARESAQIAEKLLKANAGSKKEYLSEMSKKQNLVTQTDEIRHQVLLDKEKLKEAKFELGSITSEIRSKQLNELKDVRVKIEQLTTQSVASSDREHRLLIVSPVDGVVNKLYFYTVGAAIKPGDKVAEVTPIDGGFMIEANIKTSDRGRIWVGQKATIEITAYDYAKYGRIEGILISVSPDSTTNQKGQTYYEVKIKASKERLSKDLPILAGMEANVNIVTGKKTILSYLLYPLKRMSNSALQEQ